MTERSMRMRAVVPPGEHFFDPIPVNALPYVAPVGAPPPALLPPLAAALVVQQQTAAATDQRVAQYLQQFPGHGARGVGVMPRIQFALLLGLALELRWALHALVQLLADTSASLSLKEHGVVLDGLVRHMALAPHLGMASGVDGDASLALDAALTLRNLCQELDNAAAVAAHPLTRPVLVAVLSSDDASDDAHELLRYTVDLVEATALFLAPPKDDLLFVLLVKRLLTAVDRASIVSTLRSLARMMLGGVHASGDALNCGDNIPQTVLEKVTAYLLLARDPAHTELLQAALDFLLQYVSTGAGGEALASALPNYRVSNWLVSRDRIHTAGTVLPVLLRHGWDVPVPSGPLMLVERASGPPSTPPAAAGAVLDELAAMAEPARATAWMRCVYEPHPEGQVTQILLWKAYEATFAPRASAGASGKLLPAVDFIKNVDKTFVHSSAMVLTLADNSKRFIIRGIQPRRVAVSVAAGEAAAEEYAQAPPVRQPDPKREVPANWRHRELHTLPAGLQRVSSVPVFGGGKGVDDVSTLAAMLVNVLLRYLRDEQGDADLEGLRRRLAAVLPGVVLANALLAELVDMEVV